MLYASDRPWAHYCLFATFDGLAEEQSARDRLLIGSWECGPNKAAESDRISARFDPTGLMTISFHSRLQDGQVTMVLVLGGARRYAAASDQFNETLATAHLEDIVARGKPFPRFQFPGGEAVVQALEQNFLREYSTSPLYFTTLTERVLVITDAGGMRALNRAAIAA